MISEIRSRVLIWLGFRPGFCVQLTVYTGTFKCKISCRFHVRPLVDSVFSTRGARTQTHHTISKRVSANSGDGGFNKVQTATIMCEWRSHLPLLRIFEVIATRGDNSLTLNIYIIFTCVAVVQHDLIAMTEAGLDQCYLLRVIWSA